MNTTTQKCRRGRGSRSGSVHSLGKISQFLVEDELPAKKRCVPAPKAISCSLMSGSPLKEEPPWELAEDAATSAWPDSPIPGPSRSSLGETSPSMLMEYLVYSPTTCEFRPPSTDTPIKIHFIDDIDIDSTGPPDTEIIPSSDDPSTLRTISKWEPSSFNDTELGLELCTQNQGSDVVEGQDEVRDDVPRGTGECSALVERLPAKLMRALAMMDHEADTELRKFASADMLLFDWSNDLNVFTGQREVFHGPSGPTFDALKMSPFQIMLKIWDNEIMDLIVQEMNSYGAHLQSTSKLAARSKLRDWVPTNIQELWTFFSVLIFQSILILPVEREYWFPITPFLNIHNFTKIMSYERFLILKKCLEFFNISSSISTTDRLAKILQIVDTLNEKFSSLYLPEQEVVIDESLLLCRGKLSFAQLAETKATRVGIKSYALCDSRTGYLWKMIISDGKRAAAAEDDDVHNEPGVSNTNIVFNLMGPLLNKGHTLVMDSFYNCPLLCRALKAQKTDTMGPLRLTRQFVPDSLRKLNKLDIPMGEAAFSQTHDMTITVWKDSNVVSLISSFHQIEVCGKKRNGYHKYRPGVFLDYNLAMSSLDKNTQYLHAFPMESARTAISSPFFRCLLNMSILNAFIIFSYNNRRIITHREFRIHLLDEILKKYCPQLKIPFQPSKGASHFPVMSESRLNKCTNCAMKKLKIKTPRTSYICKACNVYLCIRCFEEFHQNDTE